MDVTHGGLTMAVALAAGVLAQSLARHFRLPGIVLLLAVGALLGPEALGWVHSRSLGSGLFGLVDFAVAVVLFEGGLNLELSRLRREEGPIRKLVTLGAVVTLAGATLAALLALGWSLNVALLFGSLVVVTGPTVVAPLVRDLRLRPRMQTILEAEGVLIDPIGAILAILILNIVLFPTAQTFASETVDLLARLGFGVMAGVVGGFIIGGLLRLQFLVPQGYENIFTLAAVFLLFQTSDQVVFHSGILAVTLAGVVIGNLRTPVDRDLREFKDQLTVLLVGLLFILLAADIALSDVKALGWPGVFVIGALVLVVRPLSVWVSTRGSELSWQEQAFLAWIAPRGIVAAAIASLTAATLEERGIPGGVELRALVFLTIAITVLLAGLTARPLAMILGLRLPRRDRVAILGAQGLGLALGRQLHQAGLPVVFLDSDPKRCRQAEEQGFTVVFGDALQERALLRARVDLVGTAVGATPNEHLNSLFIRQARRLFGVPRGLVAVESLEGQEVPDHVKQHHGEVLFEGPHDLERWDVRFRHDDVVVEQFV
ncbi:MAG: cation:proton antiporter, partial [Nitrospirales bacterium]